MRTSTTIVEVFKTNVEERYESRRVVQTLREHFPNGQINFDLEDCDRILRLEDRTVINETVIRIVNACGYSCEALD
jgi:hypothetical protein